MVDLSVQLSHLSQALSSLLTETNGEKRRVEEQIPKKQQQRRLSEDAIDRLVADYEAGESAATLAERYGVHRHTIASHLEQRGVTRHVTQNKLSPADTDEAIQLYLKGTSLIQVGETFSVSAATIARALRQQGIPLRPRRGWDK